MSKRKIVLFIVEGITDKISLELLMQQVLPKQTHVIFQFVGGDITANHNINETNIKKYLGQLVSGNGKRKFRDEDYLEVIHLIDTDGAFVTENHIYEQGDLSGFHYRHDGIYAPSKDAVLKRNQHKTKIIDILINTQFVRKTIPYRIFFFSINLEHILHDNKDVKDSKKRKYAEAFQDLYIDDPQGFKNFICNNSFSLNMSYIESWNFIKKNDNSLKRYTNFDIIIKDYQKT